MNRLTLLSALSCKSVSSTQLVDWIFVYIKLWCFARPSVEINFVRAVADLGFPVGGGGGGGGERWPLGGHRPLTQALFGENVCKTKDLGPVEGGAGGAWIRHWHVNTETVSIKLIHWFVPHLSRSSVLVCISIHTKLYSEQDEHSTWIFRLLSFKVILCVLQLLITAKFSCWKSSALLLILTVQQRSHKKNTYSLSRNRLTVNSEEILFNPNNCVKFFLRNRCNLANRIVHNPQHATFMKKVKWYYRSFWTSRILHNSRLWSLNYIS